MTKARLFKNGRSQAVRLPKAFRFDGDHVFVKKIGNCVVLIPPDQSWDVLVQSLDEFSDDFMERRDQPDQAERIDVLS